MMITGDEIVSTLTSAFPDFTPDADTIDLPYLVLADFARYLWHLQQIEDDDSLEKAALLIERLHLEGDGYVKEAATIGLLEGILRSWEHAGTETEMIAKRLLPESRLWWESLNKFWRQEIPYVGADSQATNDPSIYE